MANFGIDLYLFNVLIAFLIGIPFGVFFPARIKYLIIDLAAAAIFFISISVVRYFEGIFDLDILLLGIKYGIFLLGASLAAAKWNKGAKDKEALIKQIEKTHKE